MLEQNSTFYWAIKYWLTTHSGWGKEIMQACTNPFQCSRQYLTCDKTLCACVYFLFIFVLHFYKTLYFFKCSNQAANDRASKNISSMLCLAKGRIIKTVRYQNTYNLIMKNIWTSISTTSTIIALNVPITDIGNS